MCLFSPCVVGYPVFRKYCDLNSYSENKLILCRILFSYRFSWDRIQHLCHLRRRYVQLYTVSLQHVSNVNNAELREIREIEKDLDSKVILLWRYVASPSTLFYIEFIAPAMKFMMCVLFHLLWHDTMLNQRWPNFLYVFGFLGNDTFLKKSWPNCLISFSTMFFFFC